MSPPRVPGVPLVVSARDMEGCQVQNPACYSCRFFVAGSSNAFGSCNHPNHQHSGVPITIRAQEMNCYRGFGTTDWMPALIGESARM